MFKIAIAHNPQWHKFLLKVNVKHEKNFMQKVYNSFIWLVIQSFHAHPKKYKLETLTGAVVQDACRRGSHWSLYEVKTVRGEAGNLFPTRRSRQRSRSDGNCQVLPSPSRSQYTDFETSMQVGCSVLCWVSSSASIRQRRTAEAAKPMYEEDFIKGTYRVEGPLNLRRGIIQQRLLDKLQWKFLCSLTKDGYEQLIYDVQSMQILPSR
ncbi:uncharacterized protein N7515_001781 [Penicillium bovifimosum]|uniref:Uncharacterized protein n=1 Tax=Penicillium bovifimosum TaxID=126998 RepID=A0A9W9L912_9EURO|nr:uncharacterized protein N7515_001781 [Penicillium bovifimosum]KAJ5142994.1 hypothetical protein N7515_001781 [Penicillium bovifimosum]